MQQRSEETRTKILDSAIKLFSTCGFNAASVDDICEEAALSKGAFYHQFESKQALFLALLGGWLQAIENAMETSKDKTVPETFMQTTEAFPPIFETAGEGLSMFLESGSRSAAIRKYGKQALRPTVVITHISSH